MLNIRLDQALMRRLRMFTASHQPKITQAEAVRFLLNECLPEYQVKAEVA
jgi:hypothetical protein